MKVPLLKQTRHEESGFLIPHKTIITSKNVKRKSIPSKLMIHESSDEEGCQIKKEDQENIDPLQDRITRSEKQKQERKSMLDVDEGETVGKDLYSGKRVSKNNLVKKVKNLGEKSSSDEENEGQTFASYFQQLYDMKNSKTSSNTLSKLPEIEPDRLLKLIQTVGYSNQNEQLLLKKLYSTMFPQWFSELKSDFNLLFYGYGSKKMILEDFALKYLNDTPLVIINGYVPTLSIKDILSTIATSIDFPNAVTANILDYTNEMINFIQKQRLLSKTCFAYVLIHNIDGINLRNEKTQTSLSLLASSSCFHFIASIDHIQAPLLWDSQKANGFNWVYHDCTNFSPYKSETSYENSLLLNSTDLSMRGVRHVLSSLTPNAREIFKKLFERQRDLYDQGKRSHEDLGIVYSIFFKQCSDRLLVSNDLTFRAQLTEFKDHKIILFKKNVAGEQILFIPEDVIKLDLNELLSED
ncbi:Origin recognition complex, subunit 2 domain-containing protein [Rozella allomycis CSF55]|uniref:Origin recognition complex subunit 2 n=1 Tax=Rozella allomycis (strain CSF55) TaxID=988480 RepID=A0A075AQZ9_ROZAC|nr:Origin recognition complex, subunit 2 domain-containing protein [Rozella allomycis CSF55]|eukprot:EPZ31120.1 Origin recognition complex, subunit 2 domain-containing protein [Rozella allomycis CSF55]